MLRKLRNYPDVFMMIRNIITHIINCQGGISFLVINQRVLRDLVKCLDDMTLFLGSAQQQFKID